MEKKHRPELKDALKHFFGYDDFRLNQQYIIEAVLAAKDTLAIMPTGGGKSICYQLPAMLLPGITIVISPLIALMKDQVDALQANGINGAFLNSSQSLAEQKDIIWQARSGKVKLLYIAPERIPNDNASFFSFIRELNPSLFAIDEAHCISSWGHDFRPEYLKLSVLKRQFPHVPVIALTASADKLTQQDIVEKLALPHPEIFISSFNRPNIHYFIQNKKNAFAGIVQYLKQHPDDNGIIYALSRTSTETIAEGLRKVGVSASHYHAGMDNKERSKVQEAFQRDEMRVIVATIAFGMGIDKSNVRFVIHHDVPKNIEGYYQETGRAGRDGLRSDAILFYSVGDIIKLRKFVEIENNPQQSAIALKKLQQMQEFCESESCRRQYLLQYFGEAFPSYCGSCDFCLSNLEEKDVTVDAQKLLSAVSRTGERYGANYIVDFLRGSASDKIISAHKELKTYGIGKDLNKEEWQWMIKVMLQQKMLEKTNDQYGTLQLNAKSWEILKSATKVKLVMKKAPVESAEKEEKPDYEQELFKQLRSVRLDMADMEHVPAYAIVADNSLVEMATYFPQTFGDLLNISGFGDYKVAKYGAQFLKVIKAYCGEHKLTSRMPVRAPKKEKKIKASAPAGPGLTMRQSFRMFQDGMSVAEIAEQRNLSQQTIENHLAMFVANGELSIHKLVAKNKLDKIIEVIKTTGQVNALKPLKDLLGDDITYGEIRLGLEYYKNRKI